MKLITFLFALFLPALSLLRAEEHPISYYFEHAGLPMIYGYQKGVVQFVPMYSFPVWFKGTLSSKPIELKPLDHYCYMDENYHECFFLGEAGNRLKFADKTFSYTLGQMKKESRPSSKADC